MLKYRNKSSWNAATDIALSLTSFLRKQRNFCILKFYGSGNSIPNLGDRVTIANMTPGYVASAGMFAIIDDQTISYLRVTGRKKNNVN